MSNKMEVKDDANNVFQEKKIKIERDTSIKMTFTHIKEKQVDSKFKNQVFSSSDLLLRIKNEPEDTADFKMEPEFDTISNQMENFNKVCPEQFFVNTGDLVKIKKEIEDADYKSIKIELLNEECDLPTVKTETITSEYLESDPCGSQSEKCLLKSNNTEQRRKIFRKKNKFPCPVCQKICLSSTSREGHLDLHFRKRQCVICSYCGDIFKRKKQYLIHFRNYFVKTKSQLNKLTSKCKVCSQEFSSKKNLAEHFKVHYSKPYECNICFKQYSVKSTLKRHLDAIHSILKPFKCEICLKEFALSCQYKSHMSNHKFGKQFKCEVCLKGFYQKSSLMRHTVVHEGIKFKCKLCFKEYTRKVTLESHMRLHSGEHEFKCHICQKRFTSKGALRLHLMNHAGEKPHQCEICSQRFLEKQKLLKHLKTHEKAKNFCEFCSVSFLYKVRLQRHLLAEHGENPFKCLKCGEKFPTQRDLNLHASVHVEFKMYECKICSKQFTKRAAYVRHLGGHGQNPFGCGICPQTFSSERGLREHYVTHPGEKPFHCDACLKGFHHKRSLHKHICEGKPGTGT